MEDGLKVISDKEAIKAKIEDCIKKARIEKAFDILEENAECFNASKEDIHLARANYVKAVKDNGLGLLERKDLDKVYSHTVRNIQRIIGDRWILRIIRSGKFWMIAILLLLVISLAYTNREDIFVDNKSQVGDITSKERFLGNPLVNLKTQQLA